MSLLPTTFIDAPAAPRREVWPAQQIAYVAESIPANGSVYLKQETGPGTEPGSTSWPCSTLGMVSWLLFIQQAVGAALVVEITPLDAAFGGIADGFVTWKTYPLYGTTRFNTMYGLYLPAWKVRFKVVNNSAVAVTYVYGYIKLQGVH